MAALKNPARFLANGWLEIGRGSRARTVSPTGTLTMGEACSALGTYYMRLDRLAKDGRLRSTRGPNGDRLVSVREIRRVIRKGGVGAL